MTHVKLISHNQVKGNSTSVDTDKLINILLKLMTILVVLVVLSVFAGFIFMVFGFVYFLWHWD